MKLSKKYLLACIFLFLLIKAHPQLLQEYSCITDRVDVSEMSASKTFDKNGIILSKMKYHPLSIAQFGVLSYHAFKSTKDSTYYHDCINQVKYFKDTTKVNYVYEKRGIGLPYNFNFWDLKAPWYSGMTQGYAISYLLRYYELTNDTNILPIVEKVAYVLLQKQEDGGTISKTKEGYTWIEEYPNSKKSPQVLNGYINGLIGLKEYTDFFPNDTLANRVLKETYTGLVNSLEYFDSSKWSYYNRAKKSLSNLYLRYQIYEMAQLYDIFNDEIFDNQMRIWSVLSYNKFNKSKSRIYKFPNYNFSIPVEILHKNKFGVPVAEDLLIIEPDSLLIEKNYSLRKLKRYLRKNKHNTSKKKSDNTYFSFINSHQGLMTNYVEIKLENINENLELQVYNIKNKTKIIPKQCVLNISTEIISLSFNEENLKNLIFQLKGSNLSDTAIFQFYFYNTGVNKQPYFGHNKTKSYNLKKGESYNISLKKYNTGKSVIFYKFAKNKEQLRNSKWKAKNTVSDQFIPNMNGTYQFMIIYDYINPLSMIGNFSIEL